MVYASLSRGVGVRQWHELAGDIALVASRVERVQNRLEIQMPRAGIPAIGIGYVEVKEPVTADAVRGLSAKGCTRCGTLPKGANSTPLGSINARRSSSGV